MNPELGIPEAGNKKNEHHKTVALLFLAIINAISVYGWMQAKHIYDLMDGGTHGVDEIAKQFIGDVEYALSLLSIACLVCILLVNFL